MAQPSGDTGGSGSTGQTTTRPETQRKLTPGEANFRRGAGIANLRCGDCFFFEAGTCRIVDVQNINPEDVCDQYEPDRRGKLTSGEAMGAGIVRAGNKNIVGPLRRVVPNVAIAEMYITRVAKDRQSGVKRWFSSASGVERDLYDERMSVDLFNDFVGRVESRDEVPPPFSSKAWNGGLPYLGVAHYLDLNGEGIAGPTEQIYIDGDYFKAKGTFSDSRLGAASYASIKRDIEEDLPHEFRVRVSIAFIDWKHEHEGFGTFTRRDMLDRCDMCERGLGEKIYKAGHLVHLALTRRPAYPKASIDLEE